MCLFRQCPPRRSVDYTVSIFDLTYPVLGMEVDVHSVVFKIKILNLAPAGTQDFKFAPAGTQSTKGMSERREACETCN